MVDNVYMWLGIAILLIFVVLGIMKVFGIRSRSIVWKTTDALKTKEIYTVFLIVLIISVAYYCHNFYSGSSDSDASSNGLTSGNHQGFVDQRMHEKLQQVYRTQVKSPVDNKPYSNDLFNKDNDAGGFGGFNQFDTYERDHYNPDDSDAIIMDIEEINNVDRNQDIDRFEILKKIEMANRLRNETEKTINNTISLNITACAKLKPSQKFDCHPEIGVNEQKCQARGCCWEKDTERKALLSSEDIDAKQSPVDVPFCYYPRGFLGYSVTDVKETDVGFQSHLLKSTLSTYPGDVKFLNVEVIYETDSILRVKISDARNKRYEVPLEVPKATKKAANPAYKVFMSKTGSPFVLTVKRLGTTTNRTIFSTKNMAPLIFTDQFLQLSSVLPSPYIYGIGEHRDDLMLKVNWTRRTIWSRDQAPNENTNLYGAHPFYMVMEQDGSSNGFFLLNSNAMDVVLQPNPAITWRTTGGILDFYIFLGPTPNDITRQFTSIVGRPFMPPYWSLGFHICRWGYKNVNETMQVVDGMRKAGIPQDTQWNDIDFMKEKKDFLPDPEHFGNQVELVKTVHHYGMKYIVIVDPGISINATKGTYKPYDLGLEMDVFFKNHSGQNLIGKVWPGKTVFPDFTHPNSQEYWNILVSDFIDVIPVDGLWIDMNELSNFVEGSIDGCPSTKYDSPPYVPAVFQGKLSAKTICASAKGYLGREYDIHNIYGLKESSATYKALQEKTSTRPFVISRSTYSGQGQFSGHWSGDNGATYHDMYRSISEVLTMNLFGIPMVGADICGFRGDTTYELCLRWHQLGAFYPFSRNHNDYEQMSQEPFRFDERFSNAVKDVYLIRYSLLPFLYTLFHFSHIQGDTVARPMFQEFPWDQIAYPVDSQFMWGSALLIVPVLKEGDVAAFAYLPFKSNWYDFYTGLSYDGGNSFKMDAPFDKINLLVRGGSIIPMQKPAQTTSESRINDFYLLGGFCDQQKGFGVLYWDDGESLETYEKKAYNEIEFHMNQSHLYSKVKSAGYQPKNGMLLSRITLYGVQGKPVSVNIDGRSQQFNYDAENKVLRMPDLSPKVDLLHEFQLQMTGLAIVKTRNQSNTLTNQNLVPGQEKLLGSQQQQPLNQGQPLGQGGLQQQPLRQGQGGLQQQQQPLNKGQTLGQGGQQQPFRQGQTVEQGGQQLQQPLGKGGVQQPQPQGQPLGQGGQQQPLRQEQTLGQVGQQPLRQGQTIGQSGVQQPLRQGQPLGQGGLQQQQPLTQGQPLGQGGLQQQQPVRQGQNLGQGGIPLSQGQNLGQGGVQHPLRQGQNLGQDGQQQPVRQGQTLGQGGQQQQPLRQGQVRPFRPDGLSKYQQVLGQGQSIRQDRLQQQQPLGFGNIPKKQQPFGYDKLNKQQQPLGSDTFLKKQQSLGLDNIPKKQQPLGLDNIPKKQQPLGLDNIPKKQQPLGFDNFLKKQQPLGLDNIPKKQQPIGLDKIPKKQQPLGLDNIPKKQPLTYDSLSKTQPLVSDNLPKKQHLLGQGQLQGKGEETKQQHQPLGQRGSSGRGEPLKTAQSLRKEEAPKQGLPVNDKKFESGQGSPIQDKARIRQKMSNLQSGFDKGTNDKKVLSERRINKGVS